MRKKEESEFRNWIKNYRKNAKIVNPSALSQIQLKPNNLSVLRDLAFEQEKLEREQEAKKLSQHLEELNDEINDQDELQYKIRSMCFLFLIPCSPYSDSRSLRYGGPNNCFPKASDEASNIPRTHNRSVIYR